MAYPMRKGPRDPDYRRLPGVEELKRQSLIPDKLREDPGPSTLGSRTRQMTVLLAAIGLITFFVPLVATTAPVMGQSRWSPWQILSGMITGQLPAAILLTAKGIGAVRWLTFVNATLFGSLFIYVMLAGVAIVAFGKAQRMVLGGLAGAGLMAALVELRGFSDLQLAILGGPPGSVGGQQVQAMSLGLVWFSVMTLILMIAAWKELEDL